VSTRKRRGSNAGGSQRFCMGVAWRDLKDRDLPKVADLKMRPMGTAAVSSALLIP